MTRNLCKLPASTSCLFSRRNLLRRTDEGGRRISCPLARTMKRNLRKQVLFQLNPPPAEEIHLRWMKSLRDEIQLRGNKRGGFDFICEADFIRAYICEADFIRAYICEANCSDFIVLRTISLRTYELHFCTMTTEAKGVT